MSATPTYFDDCTATIDDVARHFKCSKRKIETLVAGKKIPFMKIGRQVRLKIPEVEAHFAVVPERAV